MTMTPDTPNIPPDHPDRLRDEAVEKVRQWVNDRERQRREERRRRRYGRGRRTIEIDWEE
jgi:hypothetical protein